MLTLTSPKQMHGKYVFVSEQIDAWKSCIQIKYRISMRLSALNTAFPCVCKMPNTCNGIASSVQRVKIHIWESTQPTEKKNLKFGNLIFFSVGCVLSHMCILTKCTELAIPLHASCIIYMHGKAVFRADRRMEILYLTRIQLFHSSICSD